MPNYEARIPSTAGNTAGARGALTPHDTAQPRHWPTAAGAVCCFQNTFQCQRFDYSKKVFHAFKGRLKEKRGRANLVCKNCIVQMESIRMGNLLGPCGYQFRGQSNRTTDLALVAGYFRVSTIILVTRVMTWRHLLQDTSSIPGFILDRIPDIWQDRSTTRGCPVSLAKLFHGKQTPTGQVVGARKNAISCAVVLVHLFRIVHTSNFH